MQSTITEAFKSNINNNDKSFHDSDLVSVNSSFVQDKLQTPAGIYEKIDKDQPQQQQNF